MDFRVFSVFMFFVVICNKMVQHMYVGVCVVYVGVCGCVCVNQIIFSKWITPRVCGECMWAYVGVCGCMWMYVDVCGAYVGVCGRM